MEDIRMSTKERRRLEMLSRVKDGGITLKKSAELLSLSYRQMRRIFKRYREEGDQGLVHKGRGRKSNRRISEEKKRAILDLYTQKYEDFGPTLAAEHLARRDGYVINPETLRQWLIKNGLWKRKRRRKKHRSWRKRKVHVGEMVQMDGSPHDWFEGRGEKAVLMVMIDDASSRIFAQFFDAETTRSSMEIFGQYARTYGLPESLYVDRHSIYRCEREATVEEQLKQTGALTQFGRAMSQLNVGVILAYSPQAKGRVERANETMQDRLIKEMRLEGISGIKEGNRFLKESFLSRHNEKFSVVPQAEEDLHRRIPEGVQLDEVLCFEGRRQVQNDWTIHWKNRLFQLMKRSEVLGLVKQRITVREKLDGTIQLVHKGRLLKFEEIKERPAVKKSAAKPVVQKRTPHKPAPNHPWRRSWSRSYPQPQPDSDELGGAHSRRAAAGV